MSEPEPSSREDFLKLAGDITLDPNTAHEQLSLSEGNRSVGSEPSSREDFLKHACDITLDPNTAHEQLSLSEGNRRVTVVPEEQKYPAHPDRFSPLCQVLSAEALTGRCYWEVEWTGMNLIRIAASYRDIDRNFDLFGNSATSWALRCQDKLYSFYFDKMKLDVAGPFSLRIGVYLDHSAGVLSFYSVEDDTVELLHKVQTEFTQPLFAGVWICEYGETAYFPKLK